jgi:four helix bundle protein
MRDFRNLKVWQKAHEFVLEIYPLTAKFHPDERFGLTLQMRRSATLIPTTITHACGADLDEEFIKLLGPVKRACCDLEYLLILAKDLGYITIEAERSFATKVIEIRKMMTVDMNKMQGF